MTGMAASVNPGGPRMARVDELAYGLIEHSGEHYGQLVVYYRANGMVAAGIAAEEVSSGLMEQIAEPEE